ncbi:EAL domain-containing protein [Limisalsivibrio acetivorans]|uniref:EAL domain-containing protein n=1 Tax=Limisalsivibrio acetivorans TaxID=1304888 RepID=UPI0003B350D2|nr:EAL domain-containing protein [Limisalsivibrio acetivorans]
MRLFLVLIFLFSIFTAHAADEVSVRLKWHHQFQFAGIYMAIEQGYYDAAGLDVQVKEYTSDLDNINDIVSGETDFGIAGPELVLNYLKGEPVVSVATIIQHSPTVIMAKKSSNIRSPHDLVGKKVMLGENPIINAMLINEGLHISSLDLVETTWDINELVNDEIDATEAYLTNTPYYLIKEGIPVVYINPITYGIDFYGDTIFTSREMAEDNYEKVMAFKNATLKGWEYALDNVEETVDHILRNYETSKTREHLIYEAETMKSLMLPKLVEIGHMNRGRWQHMANTYIKLGLAEDGYNLTYFLPETYSDHSHVYLRNTLAVMAVILTALAGAAIMLFMFNWRLKKSVEQRTEELTKEIAERKEAVAKMELFHEIFENSIEAISITDKDANIIQINNSFTEVTGYTEEEVLGKNPRILKSDRHSDEFYERMWNAINREGRWSGEIWNRRKTGEAYPEWLNIFCIYNQEGEIVNYVSAFHDISEYKDKEAKIKYQAHHDALTGLPNRFLINDRLEHAISHAQRVQKQIAVIFMDLDNFKRINDTLGHPMGDKLLQHVADHLKSLMRDEDTVGRLGGDEFVIIIEEIEEPAYLTSVCQRILDSFAEPVVLDGHELYISTSIGITYFPDDGKNSEELIMNADIAMYSAKERGKNNFRFFTGTMNEEMKRRHELETMVRKGLENGEFVPFYQPRVDTASGRVNGMEALARWFPEEGKMVSPAEFIPVMEETGLIVDLGRQMFEQSCEFVKRVEEETGKRLKVSVNLSPKQLERQELVPQMLSSVKRIGIGLDMVEVELTESDIMKDVDRTKDVLDRITGAGISVFIDDFGTGYSSMYYLKHLPIQGLKIDRSFINEIDSDQNDAAIVSTMIRLADGFRLRVVAEGVENETQASILKELGCYEIQGYFYGKPMPAEQFIEFIMNS